MRCGVTTSELEAENTEQAVKALLKERNVAGAIELLSQARAAARSRDDAALASDFSIWIASLHLGEGRVVDALREFETAEADEPSNVYHKLNTAGQLLQAGRPADALRKLDALVEMLPDNASMRHGYYALRGETELRLGHAEKAVDEFRRMSSPELVRAVMPVSLSLELAALLVRERVALNECLQYLDQVKAKAQSHNDLDLMQRAVKLEQLARREV